MYIAAAVRKPKGNGPFPAIIIFHGAPGGRGMDQLVGWSRGDHGGPVWERFLQEGYVVAVADYRGGEWNQMNTPSSTGLVTAIDDGITVVDYVQNLPYVRRNEVSVYGVSLGGNLVMYLASRVPTLHAMVAGAPAPIWFLGLKLNPDGSRPDFSTRSPIRDCEENIAPISKPVLIIVGTKIACCLSTHLHDELAKHGKSVRMEVYEHGYHDFVLGNQGQVRNDCHAVRFCCRRTGGTRAHRQFVKDPDERTGTACAAAHLAAAGLGRQLRARSLAAAGAHAAVPWNFSGLVPLALGSFMSFMSAGAFRRIGTR